MSVTTTEQELVLIAAKQFHRESPEMRQFADWPGELKPMALEPNLLPVTELICSMEGDGLLLRALRDSLHQWHWRQTYTAAQVGQPFIDAYGWFELFGPTGHFHTNKLRGYVSVWGPRLVYPMHQHEAEEIYATIHGGAHFSAEGAPDEFIGLAQTRFHASNQPHSMVTTEQPFLSFVLWRGGGLGESARLTV